MPTPFPAAEFKRVQAMMPHLSALVHAVSTDLAYLNITLRSAAQFDSFTKSLMDVHSKTADAREKAASPISLGLHRSDYMLDEPSGDLLQVLHDYCPLCCEVFVVSNDIGVQPCRWKADRSVACVGQKMNDTLHAKLVLQSDHCAQDTCLRSKHTWRAMHSRAAFR